MHRRVVSQPLLNSLLRCKLLCHSDCSRSIQLFSLLAKGPHGGFKLTKEYDIKHLKSAPLCIDYVEDPENPDVAYLIWGDCDGML